MQVQSSKFKIQNYNSKFSGLAPRSGAGKTFKNFTFLIVILIFTFYILHFSVPAYAQAPDIGYSRFTPASPLYFLKGLKENLELKVAGTPRIKMLKRLEFATRRLREARTLVSGNQGLIASTLERYIGEINSLPDSFQEKDELGLKVKDALKVHLQVLEQIYGQSTDRSAKMAVRSAMNRLIKRADVTFSNRQPICRLFAQEASSSALNATERFVLAKRAGDCF